MADGSGLTDQDNVRPSRILESFVIFHREATGKIIASGGELEADFELCQLCNGKVIIEATASTDMEPPFALEGQLKDGLSFRVENARAIGSWTFRVNPPEHLILRRGKEALKRSSKFVFVLMNLQPPNFSLTAHSYNISFHRDNIQNDQIEMIRHIRLPAVTGRLTVELASGGEMDLECAKEFVDDVTHLLSLAEGNSVSVPQVEAYMKDECADIHLQEMRVGQPLLNFSLIHWQDTASFLSSVLPIFRAMPDDDRQKFRIGLQYYLFARGSGIVEEQLLNGFIVLEMLTGSKDLDLACITRDVKKPIRRDICQIIDRAKSQGQLNPNAAEKLRARVCNTLFDSRLSFREDLENVLARVSYDDLFTNAGELSDLRNQIIHRGMVKGNGKFSASWNLLALLDRLFLAKLNYRGDFYDWSNGEYKRRSMAEVIRS